MFELSDDDRARLNETYRELHRHPELSMQEHRTAAFIETALDRIGIEHFRCGGTGVVALQRNGDGPTVAFRADIDGLPIEEQTGAEYRSEMRGTLPDGTEVPVMHGCGHDSHVSAALAACEVFERERSGWAGTIVWIFQPGEETAAGAASMVADGLWERAPHPTVVLGQHVVPGVPAGSIALCEGPAMAAADALKVTIHGKQSHGSQPQDSVDPIVLGAFIVARLQAIVAREIAPQAAAVVTCGTFHAGVKENIIPERAELTLNTRTLTDEVRDRLIPAIRRVISAEAEASGAPEPEIEELYRFPTLVNDPVHTGIVRDGIAAELGAEHVLTVGSGMGSEDFGGLASAIDVPNVYWFFGAYAAGATEQPVNHSPQFLPDGELPLVTGARAAIAGIRAALGAGDRV